MTRKKVLLVSLWFQVISLVCMKQP